MTGEAQRILRQLIAITWNRTGLETSKVVTGTAGTNGNLSAWNADGDLVDANASIGAMPDNTFRIVDNADQSKKLAFEVSGVTTATTRTLTVPNASGTIALTSDLTSGYQPLDADLTSWAAITRASGFDTFVATPSSANLATLVTNETGSGALVFASGPSLTGPVVTNFLGFPATQSASSGANDLDDYEEGTWTPSLGGNATYATQAGKYGKVGSYVYVSVFLAVTTLGTGSTTTMSGLPFTSAGLGTGPALAVSQFTSLALSPVFLAGFVTFSATTLTFNGLTAAAVSTSNTMAIFGNSAVIKCSGWYFVDP